MPDAELLPRLEHAREITRRLAVPLVVNDRPDLAVLCEADFVHVGQDDLPVDAARLRPEGRTIDARARGDRRADGDYIGVGPVHSTPTKAKRPPVGLELRPVRAAVHARQPWFAIGGIDETNVGEVVAAGAHRIAVVRAIGDVPDPELAARTLQGGSGQRLDWVCRLAAGPR